MSDGYLASDWCRQELEAFIEAAGPSGVAGRIFVVHREEIPFERWPAALRDLNGYPFYLKDPATGDVRPMAVPKPDPQEKEYFARLYRLRNELAEHLKKMKAGTTASAAPATAAPAADAAPTTAVNVASPATSDQPTVFLAEVTGDLYEHREQVAEYLTQSGCRVLPAQYYSRTPADFKKAMDQDLCQSAVYAQLLGPYPTPRTANLPQGYEGLQWERALASNKPVLQWRSPDLDPAKERDDQHRQLVSAPDVLATDLEEFKRIISETVRKTLARAERVTAGGDGESFILLSASGGDLAVADAIAEQLAEHAVAFDIVDETTSLPDLAESDEYDGLMIVYGGCPQDWVQQQVRLCRRVALQKKHRAPECAVFVGPPRDKAPLRCRPPRFHVIDHDDQTRLEAYIKAVVARRSSA